MNSGLKLLRRFSQNRMFSTIENDGDGLHLYVGNIPWTVSSKELEQYFSKFGPVSSADVVFDKKTGLSRGRGMVCFWLNKSFMQAIETKPHILEGNVLIVDLQQTENP